MRFPEDVHKLLLQRYKTKHRKWLEASATKKESTESAWPLAIKLGAPTEIQAKKQLSDVRAWVAAWQSWNGIGVLSWSERRWRTLGTQRIPERLVFNTPLEVAQCIGEAERWELVEQRYEEVISRWPMLSTKLSRYYDLLADYSKADYQRLIDMITWINLNPDSSLYPRQLPVAGLDSKWLEVRKGVLTDLVGVIKGDIASKDDFFQLCGLKAPPQLIRIRILDSELRDKIGGLSDISMPLEQLAELDIPVTNVFIVENLQTGLAFDDIQGSIVIMQLGYGVNLLGGVHWLAKARCFYWGDLDTHGFAILNRARTYLPALTSILMNEESLHLHRELWVEEKSPHGAEALPLLSDTEQALYKAIKQNVWGQNIRLEQERILWAFAWQTLQKVT